MHMRSRQAATRGPDSSLSLFSPLLLLPRMPAGPLVAATICGFALSTPSVNKFSARGQPYDNSPFCPEINYHAIGNGGTHRRYVTKSLPLERIIISMADIGSDHMVRYCRDLADASSVRGAPLTA